MATKYTFESSAAYEFRDDKRRHRRGSSSYSNTDHSDVDPLDGNGSLTYSAASSINSGNGESTDSSFADMMKVLDIQDSKELTQYLRWRKDEKSVAESLAYSTDAESHLRSLATDAESALHGADLLSTITGHLDSSNPSFFAEREEPLDAGDLMFSPAEHTDSIRRRKEKKRRERMEQRKLRQLGGGVPRPIKESRQETPPSSVHGTAASTATTTTSRTAPTSHHARPPKASRYAASIADDEEDEDVWYAKWWMFCFPDTINSMTEKR